MVDSRSSSRSQSSEKTNTPSAAPITAQSTNPHTASPYKWHKRRKRKKRKPKKALFTQKKVRTTTSNIRIPKDQRRKLYRDRCRQKKALVLQGRLMPKDKL